MAAMGRRGIARSGMIALAAVGLCGAASQAQYRPVTPERTIATLVRPVSTFTLPNGLRVIVQTDRTSPTVTIGVAYGVGAYNETADRGGFAHLFEHMMFGASDNAPDTYRRNIHVAGGWANANTYPDTTNFNATVPVGALDRALFLEADRMGHMARSITPAALDLHRSVVRNEIWLWSSRPGGSNGHRAAERLFPVGHPYRQTVYGTISTLDSARAEDARDWHARFYTPSNAVLALVGDIDPATARTLVARRFGGLAAGSRVPRPVASVPTLPAPVEDVTTDAVGSTIVTRNWATPGWLSKDGPALDMAAKTLGTLGDSWLEQALIHDDRVATSIMTSTGASADSGTFVISMTLAPGVTRAAAEQRLDAVLARFFRDGPTPDQLRRVVMRDIGMAAARADDATGRALALATGELLAGDPQRDVRRLRDAARVTPGDVRAAARRWLTRPAYTQVQVPGPRPAPPPAPAALAEPATTEASTVKAALPPVEPIEPPRFPPVQHLRLANGIPIAFARRPGTPVTRVTLEFDAGTAADGDRPGGQALLMRMLGEGTTSRDASALARDRDRLGAMLWFETSVDASLGTLTVPSAALAPALDMMADMARHPAFDPAAVARQAGPRGAIGARQATPWSVLAPRLYGPGSPYGPRQTSDARPAPDAAYLRALQQRWLRPDTARLFVVSDLDARTVRAMAERAFGDWQAQGAPGRKDFAATVATPPAPGPSRVVLIDRPDGAQADILVGGAVPASVFATPERADAAYFAAGALIGRLNEDLRERRGWTYFVAGGIGRMAHAAAFTIQTSVQTDKGADALAAIRDQVAAYVGRDAATREAFEPYWRSGMAAMPLRFDTADAVMSMMIEDRRMDRPDDYQAGVFARYSALTPAAVAAAARAALAPDALSYVVAGDARRLRPQLERLGFRVEILPADR